MINLFAEHIGAKNVVSGEALDLLDTGYCQQAYAAGILLTPCSTQDLVRICELANTHAYTIVAHGGLTGLVDGTASVVGQVCVSFKKMNKILHIDADQSLVIAEPGVVLQDLFDATEPYGLMPGVDIPARGSCTLGGLVATNAGGVRVIRYGMTRENIMGLEVVLANGEVIDATNKLMKNNAGYDLKQNFIGSEGTLGLVSKVVMRLHPTPKAITCALVACDNMESLVTLLSQSRLALDAQLLSFEAMWPDYYNAMSKLIDAGEAPISTGYGMYAIIEVTGNSSQESMDCLTAFLENAFNDELIVDAVLASSEAQRQAIWRIRDDSDLLGQLDETYLSYDVGMQVQHLHEFTDKFTALYIEQYPHRIPYIFGHMGDGNLHILLLMSNEECANHEHFDDLVYSTLSLFEGTTVSAEHGIGLTKKPHLKDSRSEAYVGVMKMLKTALDPNNILNPGKVL